MVRVGEHVRSTHSQDGGIVLDVVHGQMFRLNFVGSKILELLKHGRTESEIADQLAHDFGIERTSAQTDVREFLETLEKHHLVADFESNSPF